MSEVGLIPRKAHTDFITFERAVVFGCLGVGMAFVVEQMGGTVLQASLTFNGAIGAPLVGVFILGACFTRANWIGALVGGTIGFVFPIWLGIGKYVRHPQDFKLATSVTNCSIENQTWATTFPNSTFRSQSTLPPATITSPESVTFNTSSLVPTELYVILGKGEDEVDDNLQLHFWKRLYGVISSRSDRKSGENNEIEDDNKSQNSYTRVEDITTSL